MYASQVIELVEEHIGNGSIMMTSSLTGEGVHEAFEEAAKIGLEQRRRKMAEQKKSKSCSII